MIKTINLQKIFKNGRSGKPGAFEQRQHRSETRRIL